jgi:DNA-binding NtrC family response regulator
VIEAQSSTSRAPELHGTPLVMIVDDDPPTLAALKRALASEPYAVVTSEHPKLALRWLLRRDASLVISDRRMPEMAGDRFLCQVRRMAPRAALVMLTAYPEAAPGPPFVTLLAKPWDDATLRKTIRQLLKEREHTFGSGSADAEDDPT